MNPQQALGEATMVMQAVIDIEPIGEEELTRPTPCREFDVDALCRHMLDTHELLITGGGGTPAARTGSIGEQHAAAGTAAVSHWARRGTDGTIDLGGHELRAGMGLSLHTLEVYVHAWDLARALDRPFVAPDSLTSQMWSFAQDFVSDDSRGEFPGAPYAAAVEIPDGTDPVARLIAHTGRDPFVAAA